MFVSTFITLALALSSSARPFGRRASFDLANGQEADKKNTEFASLTPNSACQVNENACVNGQFAKCDFGKFSIQACGPGTTCKALPLTNSQGTSVTCTTETDFQQRMAATGFKGGNSGGDAGSSAAKGVNDSSTKGASATSSAAGSAASKSSGDNNAINNAAQGGKQDQNGNKNQTNSDSGNNANGNNSNGGGDPQTSLTLDPSVIAKGFAQNGLGGADEEAGQAASLTSTNNFINFCLGKTLTDGKQLNSSSCNPAPIGDIPSTDNIPSCKFKNPKNGDSIPANQKFTIDMNIQKMVTGDFVNADTNYFSAPQQLVNGQITGHSHFVVEELQSKDATDPLDPLKFAFFKGINTKAQNGVLSTPVDDGLPAGEYRLCSINSSSNHQPVIAPIAQHGSLDDCVYFTVGENGNNNTNNGGKNTANNSANAKASATGSANNAADTQANKTVAPDNDDNKGSAKD